MLDTLLLVDSSALIIVYSVLLCSCTLNDIEGCECDDGYVFHRGECIEATTCGCLSQQYGYVDQGILYLTVLTLLPISGILSTKASDLLTLVNDSEIKSHEQYVLME